MHDRGYEVNVLIKCSLKVMTQIWTCEKTFNHAVAQKEIEILGPSVLTSRFQKWLCSSSLSHLGTLENMPTLVWGKT